MAHRWLLLLCVPLLACPGPKTPTCAEQGSCPPDEPVADAGEDAGTDAGADAGEDAGAPDAGDGGDAGDPDAGADAGPVDAGCGLLDAGNPPNLLVNPGFECGDGLVGWRPSASAMLTVEAANARTGGGAARLVAMDGGVPSSLFLKVPLAQSGIHTYCATAWVRGEPVSGNAKLSLWAMDPSGGLMQTDFAAPITSAFSQLHVSAATKADDNRVTLRVWMPSPAKGAALVIDDAELWATVDGGCLSH